MRRPHACGISRATCSAPWRARSSSTSSSVTATRGRCFEKETAASWRQFKTLRAVQRAQIHPMDPGLVNRMGPRVVEGAEAICGALDRVRQGGGK